ncbi:family 43 glycosylhydrolase [Novosphingobium sp. ZN18A2]|uniref:family 43 glycosylhydrolase n=1 Tax=Novosphingobium sp. ZN18A2 TaxID=3079861 RepID=UPI0030CECBB6
MTLPTSPTPTPTPTPSATPTATLATIDTASQLKIVNVSTGEVLTVAGGNQAAGTAVATAADNSSDVQRWHVMPMRSGQYNIENMLTHQVIGISNASTAGGAAAVQWADNGTNDHLWAFYKLSNGNYVLKNANSGLYLQSDTSGTITQGARSTSSDTQEWTIDATGAPAYPMPMTVMGTGTGVHDPNMIRDTSGTYWLYGTHNTLAKSTDLVTFTSVASGDISPDFSWWASKNTTGGGGRTDIWAPSVMYANGTYYQYYSIPIYDTPSKVGTNQGAEAVIALATSKNPDGPWTDAGEIISSCGITAGCTTGFNAIDPAPYIDSAGNWWLTFGSWEDGIHILQLDPATGLRLSSNNTLYDIARRGAGEEGPFIFPQTVGGTHYYYYFAPINECCQGTNSTYRIIVGRSTSPTGPFVDRGGIDLKDGGGTILLSTHGNIFGPGGQSVMEGPTAPLLVYHYYDGSLNGAPRLGLNKLTFDADGWPHVE